MRRDYFTLDVSNVDSTGMPTVHIDYEGPEDQLTKRLIGPEGDPLNADDIDVSYRLRDPIDETDASGVFAITNRTMGEFIFELNADAEPVFEFVRAAREYGTTTDEPKRYTVRVTIGGAEEFEAETATLLVYDETGELRRGRSLIPNGVEL